jgi:hypothetical protein
MKNMLAIAAVVVGFGTASPAARAQGYIVNGHAASPEQVQLLASYGVPPGHWVVDGWGISPAASGQPAADKSSTLGSGSDRR